jgi:ESS family glutamate:Na+ symporter
MGLKLWELSSLALAMIVILLAQCIALALFAYSPVFHAMGKNYEASCFVTASCGFGMGATANAMANVAAVNKKYGPSPKALFIVPLVGALFIDFFNSLIITGFLKVLR